MKKYKKKKKKYYRKKKIDLFDLKVLGLIVILLICIVLMILHINKNGKNEITIIKQEEYVPREDVIEITTAGDCTLGTDTNFGYNGQFDWWFKNKAQGNYGYFFEKVKYLFENDDYSYVNLEGTLTTYNKKTTKKYNFKGDPKYVNILLSGGIEGVNIANNHSNDYGTEGYDDTKKYLQEAGIDYFGHDNVLVKTIKGKKIAFVGYTGVGLWINSDKEMQDTIKKLKEEEKVDIVIANFHWGIEYAHSMTNQQRSRAHLAIDSGADIVIGSHPHCLQGLETYKGKYIVYSLGNFVFGGNSHPKQIGKECIIVKMYFNFTNDKLTNIEMKVIPCLISSISSRNNYQPVVAEGKNKTNMINTMNKYSINYKLEG